MAESKDTPITFEEIQTSDWVEGTQGNNALHDYLLIATSGEAHTIMGTVPNNGLEAWRLLSKRFDPRGPNMIWTDVCCSSSLRMCSAQRLWITCQNASWIGR